MDFSCMLKPLQIIENNEITEDFYIGNFNVDPMTGILSCEFIPIEKENKQIKKENKKGKRKYKNKKY